MTQYVATVNVPGYLPMDDDPPVFDTAQEAWAYLAEERERGEDQTEGDEYSDTRETLAALGAEAPWDHPERAAWLGEQGLALDGSGTVHGPTPGYEGSHDLGLTYAVTAIFADPDFVRKLEQHTADVHTEWGQPVVFHSPEMRERMGDWLATPFGTHRDADTVTRSNYRTILADLTGRFPDDVEDHRFGHWAVGWLERIYVRTGADTAIIAVSEWVDRLEQYPLADESDHSELESEEIFASVEEYLYLDVFRGSDYAADDPVVEAWSDYLAPNERIHILNHVLAHGDYWPDHDGTDVLWDSAIVDGLVYGWLSWALADRPEPELPGQEPIDGMEVTE